ncbi:5921_t:CDS:1 [Paraglomus occultum]|uniref:5921_t:CDS:1 n=1 Tax=Paraglomus occultum TaxID=144539 RepID=A0A9N9CRE4_9GLOM|nr:5921_t:CDS:1 [Paraglomus occultum]
MYLLRRPITRPLIRLQACQLSSKSDSNDSPADDEPSIDATTTTTSATKTPDTDNLLSKLSGETSADRGVGGLLDVLAKSRQQRESPDFYLASSGDGSGPSQRGRETTADVSRLLKDMLVHTSPMYKIYINSSLNNTIVTLADHHGQVVCTKSGGAVGFKKAERGGYEAAHQAAMAVIATVKEKKLKVGEVELILKGIGQGREAAFKALASPENSWSIKQITDATPIPFNGCRPPKVRRL